jgi:hypothetical protein
MMPRRERQHMTDCNENPERSEAALKRDPTDTPEAREPTEQIDRAEPMEPIESTEPLEPILRIDCSEPIDQSDLRAPMTAWYSAQVGWTRTARSVARSRARIRSAPAGPTTG